MENSVTVYLSIGSNMGQRLQTLQQAIVLLGKEVGPVMALSKIYESAAWGFEGDDFLNACIAIQTRSMPENILQSILSIEKKLGRERLGTKGYQPRPIDIDIVYYGHEVIASEGLTVPHRQMGERRFVLQPLADIAPQFYHPILGKDTRNLLQECRDKSSLKKINAVLYPDRQSLFSQIGFMAIEGNIGAGKTSLSKKMAADLNAKLVLERFADNPFLPPFYKDPARYAFPLEMSFLADRYQQFSDDTSQYDLFKNFLISDYDIFKSLIFAKITLQEQEYELYRRIFHVMYKEVRKPRLYVFLYQTTARLMGNIKKRGRDYEQGIDPDYLEKINRGYFDHLKGSPEVNSLVLDASELDFMADPEDFETIVRNIQDHVVARPN